MKKFKFTLQPLFNYKKTIEKTQKAELKRAQRALMELREEERRLEEAYAENERSLEKALRDNDNVGAALVEHDAYFRYLRDALRELRLRIVETEEYKNECEARLITTMKEIKTYTKLREEQYWNYRKEIQAEEDKEMGDIVSFNAISE
ncbi:MAG: hypothetical protein LBH28_01365 [Oscillospiraceae bacterium]|jgi:flagellar FliJ protein|nr:hypothetical protein [Oscillospiraceae bacterium]